MHGLHSVDSDLDTVWNALGVGQLSAAQMLHGMSQGWLANSHMTPATAVPGL